MVLHTKKPNSINPGTAMHSGKSNLMHLICIPNLALDIEDVILYGCNEAQS